MELKRMQRPLERSYDRKARSSDSDAPCERVSFGIHDDGRRRATSAGSEKDGVHDGLAIGVELRNPRLRVSRVAQGISYVGCPSGARDVDVVRSVECDRIC